MKIIVRSRHEAEQLNIDTPHAFISITNPAGDEAALQTNDKTLDVLRLQFDDVISVSHGDMIRQDHKREPVFFMPEHAEQIFNFYNKVKDVDTLVVHCEAGQSRSAGVASFLAAISGNDPKPFQVPPKTPNSRVRNVMRHYWLETQGVLVA